MHSDNGPEFGGSDFESLTRYWAEQRVRGKPRKSRVQGAVESSNKSVRRAVRAWCKQHGTSDWYQGLAQINCTSFMVQVLIARFTCLTIVTDVFFVSFRVLFRFFELLLQRDDRQSTVYGSFRHAT